TEVAVVVERLSDAGAAKAYFPWFVMHRRDADIANCPAPDAFGLDDGVSFHFSRKALVQVGLPFCTTGSRFWLCELERPVFHFFQVADEFGVFDVYPGFGMYPCVFFEVFAARTGSQCNCDSQKNSFVYFIHKIRR